MRPGVRIPVLKFVRAGAPPSGSRVARQMENQMKGEIVPDRSVFVGDILKIEFEADVAGAAYNSPRNCAPTSPQISCR